MEFAEKDAAEVEVGDGGLGGVPGLRAELLLRLAEAERRRNSGPSVTQGSPGAAEQREGGG